MKITVLGAGAWGTALARLLCQGKHEVTLWGHRAEWLAEIRQTGRNERFLPGVELPRRLYLLMPDEATAYEADVIGSAGYQFDLRIRGDVLVEGTSWRVRSRSARRRA